jgi:hypothetical protein
MDGIMKGKYYRRSPLYIYCLLTLIGLSYGFSFSKKTTISRPNGTFDLSISGSLNMQFKGTKARFQIEHNPAMNGNPEQVTIILEDKNGFRMTPYYIAKKLKAGTYKMDALQSGALFGSKDHSSEYASTTGSISFSILSPDHVKGSLTCKFSTSDRSKTISVKGTFDAFPLKN